MLWVLLFLTIAVGGVVMVVCYAVWLAHKASDVYSEVAVLAGQAAELAELASEIGPPQHPGGRDPSRDLTGSQTASF